MKRSTSSSRRDSQGGYALLMIFLMAAIIALMLYQQLPRVAFESERDKEQLLIDRGEQYIRAIQLYYVANQRRYPTSIEDLEKREKRFLRRRYIDPYTGKDEWRIIHTNGGFLTDSLVQKPPAASDSQNASNTPGGVNPADGQPQVNAAVLQRPSDRPVTPTPGFGQPFPQQDPNAQSVNTPLPPITLQPQQGPGALPPITLQPGGGNQPGLPPITLTPIGAQSGQPAIGQVPGQGFRVGGGAPVTPIPGQPGVPGQPAVGGPPGGILTGVPPGFRLDPNGQLVPNTAVGTQILNQSVGGQPPGFPVNNPGGIPGQPISPQPGGIQPNQPDAAQGSPNAALTLINQLLTNPRQTTSAPVQSGNQIGAIAGIASTHKGPSIKVYKDQNKYELWEFVFSPTASTVPGAGVPGGSGVPGNGPGRGGPIQPGGGNQPGPFGTPPFGGPGGGTGGGQQPGIFGPNGGPGGGQQPIFGPGPGR